ncbi:MAG: 5-formyltetrahydrofolate cyclo-ligase [Chlamydiales bacterium]
MENPWTKPNLRLILKGRRDALPEERRKEAGKALLEKLEPLLHSLPLVLSFSSLPHEIDMSFINNYLEEQGSLVLPKVVGEKLLLFHVLDSKKDLNPGSFQILEPVGGRLVDPVELSFALIPGLGFDAKGRRVGYGGGFYDRLLPQIKVNKMGVAFREQLVEKIPTTYSDQAVDGVCIC